jgi:hypothetical protein
MNDQSYVLREEYEKLQRRIRALEDKLDELTHFVTLSAGALNILDEETWQLRAKA